MDLPIAARLELEFRLRPLNDVWEARQYQSYLLPASREILTFYGPDLDTSRVASFETSHGTIANLDTSVSSVIPSRDLNDLPLTGRDAYALLVLLPGVTADTTTARGLGFSVNGQRPSSANYLLDGLENNNMLITGPLGILAPEPLEEYRISTSNFSAEFGHTAGFLANAITRSGTNQWHGMAYTYVKNAALDANNFQENLKGAPRAPNKELEPGGTLSGPVRRNRLYFAGSLDLLRFRSRDDAQQFALPTAQYIASTNASGIAGKLLREFPAAITPQGPPCTSDAAQTCAGLVTITPPVAIDRVTGVARLDYLSTSGAHRLFARVADFHERQPDLLYTPYPQFSSPFHNGSLAAGAGWTWQIGSSVTQELRFGRTGDGSRYDRPHSEVPTFQIGDYYFDANGTANLIDLPGSASSFGYRDLSQNWELVENWSWTRGRHLLKFGGGWLQRSTQSAFTEERDGKYQFGGLSDFDNFSPVYLYAAYDRADTGIQSPQYNRAYRLRQLDAIVQDDFRVTPRLTLNFGLRYDSFGAPVNTGPVKDALLTLGPGNSIVERLEGLHYAPPPSGNQPLFAADRGDIGPRFGFSYDWKGDGAWVARGSYGVFYDRPFDNLWQIVSTNRQIYGAWTFQEPLASAAPAFAEGQGTQLNPTQLHAPQLFQPGLRNPRIQSAFLGLRHPLTDGVSLEVDALASRGRGIWTTDIVNRPHSQGPAQAGRFISEPEEVDYRSNQGSSDYAALAATLRMRRGGLSGQISYTWSHSIDNQSDALAGIFEDYNQPGIASKPDVVVKAAFTQQFDSSSDRGNSDFDQRQNLAFFAVYSLPGKLRGWDISGLGALRSGLPYSVYGSPIDPFVNQRADLVDPALAYAPVVRAFPGGKQLLNPAAFRADITGRLGNTARNEFAGPGLVSADLSVSRTFRIPSANESRRVTLRADFYNALNHANLGNPQTSVNGTHFGQALYGRDEKFSGFPVLAPFNETARQVQLMARFEF